MSSRITILLIALLLACTTPAWGDAIYSFAAITNNSIIDTQIGEAQLQVLVKPYGSEQVIFTFINNGPSPSSITDVYFDDGGLVRIAEIIGSGGGVEFEKYANPANLPGGKYINFAAKTGLSADSNSPVQPNGVNPGETLTVVADLATNVNYDSIISAIELGLANPGVDMEGGLRIGIHAQGFASGGSESFVNGDIAAAPLPPIILGGLALMGLCAMYRRRSLG